MKKSKSNVRTLTATEASDLLIRQRAFEDAMVAIVDNLKAEIHRLELRLDYLENKI